MDKQRFKWCCGTVEIGGFYEMNKNDAANEQRLKELEEQIIASLSGAVICTTNGEQPRSAKVLEKNDYKTILEFVNPNSGNTVKIWLKDLTKDIPVKEV
jgi:hypothetical protein